MGREPAVCHAPPERPVEAIGRQAETDAAKQSQFGEDGPVANLCVRGGLCHEECPASPEEQSQNEGDPVLGVRSFGQDEQSDPACYSAR
jgi:hypothetical protein